MLSKQTIDFLESIKGPFILHISDTPTSYYANIERLLKQIRPTLLIHTGDLADEYKVGRIPEHLPGYRSCCETPGYNEGKCAAGMDHPWQ